MFHEPSSEIAPDDKDWTWVLERACPECGADVSTVDAVDVAGMIRSTAISWRDELDRSDVRRRARPDRWSALEYGAHVRDVYRLYLERLDLMITHDDPLFANWDQDRTALEDRYDLQDPAEVAAQLEVAAAALADAFDAVEPGQWDRRGRRSDGAAFTIASFARYLIHDPLHHLWDVGAARR
jgi:hypothetical protein